jgi:hypothetical protein
MASGAGCGASGVEQGGQAMMQLAWRAALAVVLLLLASVGTVDPVVISS